MERKGLVEEVAGDREHGAAWLSLRALRGIGARAAELAAAGAGDEALEEVRRLALAVAGARPAMPVIRNRVHRLMASCRGGGLAALARAAAEHAGRAEAAERRAAERAGERVAGARVLTLSRSATATAALLAGGPRGVTVAESRPGGEGGPLAAELAAAGLVARLVPDAALATAATEVDLVLVGADAVLPDGAVVNKVGSWLAALAAREAGIPFLVAAAADKVGPVPVAEIGRERAERDPSAPVPVWAPLFELVPARLVTGVITERRTLDAAGVAALAAELATLGDW